MAQLKLIRVEANPIHGVFGVLLIDDAIFCCTLEPRDLNNQKKISCIPSTIKGYTCTKTRSFKFGDTWMVNDVPNRGNILFHAGNTVEHTEGCILLGETFGKLNNPTDQRAILNSGTTFKKFLYVLDTLAVKSFNLSIIKAY